MEALSARMESRALVDLYLEWAIMKSKSPTLSLRKCVPWKEVLYFLASSQSSKHHRSNSIIAEVKREEALFMPPTQLTAWSKTPISKTILLLLVLLISSCRTQLVCLKWRTLSSSSQALVLSLQSAPHLLSSQAILRRYTSIRLNSLS